MLDLYRVDSDSDLTSGADLGAPLTEFRPDSSRTVASEARAFFSYAIGPSLGSRDDYWADFGLNVARPIPVLSTWIACTESILASIHTWKNSFSIAVLYTRPVQPLMDSRGPLFSIPAQGPSPESWTDHSFALLGGNWSPIKSELDADLDRLDATISTISSGAQLAFSDEAIALAEQALRAIEATSDEPVESWSERVARNIADSD